MQQSNLNLGEITPENDSRVKVLLPLPLKGPLDYKFHEDLVEGTLVEVPLSGRKVVGVVWKDTDRAAGRIFPLEKLKQIERIVNAPPLPRDLLAFIEWVSAYTLASMGAVLRMSLSSPAAFQPIPVKRYYTETIPFPYTVKRTVARESVLDIVSDGGLYSASELAEAAGVSEAVVRGLYKANGLSAVERSVDKPFKGPDINIVGPILSDEQAIASDAIKSGVQAGDFKP